MLQFDKELCAPSKLSKANWKLAVASHLIYDLRMVLKVNKDTVSPKKCK